MGVDFYSCKECGETFPDCGEYFTCKGCYKHFCDGKCAGAKPLTAEFKDSCECGDFDAGECSCELCSYCLGEKVTDADLLKYALKSLKLTRDELAAKFHEETK